MKNNFLTLLLLGSMAAVACTQTVQKTSDDGEKPKEEKTTSGYAIGDEATDFSLKNVDGKMVSLADYKDAKGFIVTFTCNTCPFAVLYEDRIQALNEKYGSQGYPVIAIMPNNTDVKPGDNMQAMKQRAQEKGFTFPYLIDKGQKVYPKFGATKTPHIYVLEKTKKGNKYIFLFI